MALTISTVHNKVDVIYNKVEVAQAEIKLAEQQRLFGLVPNYFVNYNPDAAPLNAVATGGIYLLRDGRANGAGERPRLIRPIQLQIVGLWGGRFELPLTGSSSTMPRTLRQVK